MIRILFVLTFLLPLVVNAQTRIDGDFPFDTDPEKAYSIYIPSGYESGTPNKVMLALHPFNPARSDAMSWCDTLVDFAEENQLILICPDGGEDGQIDDPIDTAFTSTLIDSMAIWYDLDFNKFYGMGFSWGGRGIYTYGLSHDDLIKGYIPIGPAINGTTEVNEDLQMNAAGKPFYLVHGELDAPSIRFYPVRDSLISKGAIVEWDLLDGVGHTIDFPGRNEQLRIAFEWIDSVNCNTLSLIELEKTRFFDIYPNPLKTGEKLTLDTRLDIEKEYFIQLQSMEGKSVIEFKKVLFPGKNQISVDVPRGQYLVKISSEESQEVLRLYIN